jgi:hypothetical protein
MFASYDEAPLGNGRRAANAGRPGACALTASAEAAPRPSSFGGGSSSQLPPKRFAGFKAPARFCL